MAWALGRYSQSSGRYVEASSGGMCELVRVEEWER